MYRSILTSLLLAVLVLVVATSPAAAQVSTSQKISATTGGLSATLDAADFFGQSVVGLGDVDGDGVEDIAVGASQDDDGGTDHGAVHVLFLTTSGTVKAEQKISATAGGLGTVLDAEDTFGQSVGTLGDIDADVETVTTLVVGAPGDDDGGTDRGAAYVLFLRSDGTAKSVQKISDTAGGFGGALADGATFGQAVAGAGDLDNDGTTDLAIGAPGDGGTGAVYVLLMNADGTVRDTQRISDGAGGLPGGTLGTGDAFGASIAGLGLLDGDGVPDLAVGAPLDDDGGTDRGAVYVLAMDNTGVTTGAQKISSTTGGLSGPLGDQDIFGVSLAGPGSLDGDAMPELVVGANRDDDGGSNRGAVYILGLNPDGTVAAENKVSATSGGFGGGLDNNDFFGISVAAVGDLNGDGTPDLAAGANGDDDGASGAGAVWMLFVDATALPVELTTFEGVVQDASVLLQWTTASETGNVGFEVQHAAPDAPFRAAGFVEGAGTTTREQAYSYAVTSLDAGTHQFRLKQVDADGTFAFSPVVEVVVEVPGAYALTEVYPNPFNPRAQVTLAVPQAQTVRVEVVNLLGQRQVILFEGRLEANTPQTFTIEAADWPTGLYLIRALGEQFSVTRTAMLLR